MKKPRFVYYLQALFRSIFYSRKNVLATELIQITADDKKLPLPEDLKYGLTKILLKRREAQDESLPLRIILNHEDKEVNINISRWLAASSQQSLYRVDLSKIASKYIGETEKNLANVFSVAQNKNWVLFFDEADAIFGKRTNVKDAHDKYANLEVNYLLQRIENYNGNVVINCSSLNCFKLLKSKNFTRVVE